MLYNLVAFTVDLVKLFTYIGKHVQLLFDWSEMGMGNCIQCTYLNFVPCISAIDRSVSALCAYALYSTSPSIQWQTDAHAASYTDYTSSDGTIFCRHVTISVTTKPPQIVS